MSRIAICIFGQARFFKETSESFRREFNIPGHEVDVFIHTWSDIGFTPEDDWNKTNKKADHRRLKDELYNCYNPAGLIVEDPEDEFGQICDSVYKVIDTVRDNKWRDDGDWRAHLGKLHIDIPGDDLTDTTNIRVGSGQVIRYEMGQHYSLDKCIELKAWYEKENDFQYDLVIRTRTDAMFIPEEVHANEEEYYHGKEQYYLSSKGPTNPDHRGIHGVGLKCVLGLGNNRDVTQPYLSSVIVKDNKVVHLGPRPHYDESDITSEWVDVLKDSILDQNGMIAFPAHIHISDRLMFADNDSANRVWGTLKSTYISLVCNDIIRFVGNRGILSMPSGEVINATGALLNNTSLYWNEPEGLGDYYDNHHRRRVDILSALKRERTIKIVHPDADKRKHVFKTLEEDHIGFMPAVRSYDEFVSTIKQRIDASEVAE